MVRSPESPLENFLPVNCGRLGPVGKGLGYLTPSDQLKTRQDLYLMVLRGNPDSWALLLPGLLNKRNKIGDVITSLLVVLKSSCIWGFFLKALTNQEVTLWGGGGMGSYLFFSGALWTSRLVEAA